MYIVNVICSDEDCAEEIEAVVATMEEVDDIVCECDCGTVLLSVADLDTGAQVIELRPRGRSSRLAA
jgi:hypothetical protein